MTEESDKKAQFLQSGKSRRRFPALLVLAVLLVAGGLGFWFVHREGGKYQDVAAVNDLVSIPRAAVADGKAHFFRYSAARADVNFFLVQGSDGLIRAAFDTCDVCYREHKGYRQEGGAMVCNNCNQQFATDLVNAVKGGCNPAPLRRQFHGDQVVIRTSDLEAGLRYFVSGT